MKKVLMFSNADWHFYEHLLPIAVAAIHNGYEVTLLTNVINHKKQIEEKGIRVIPISINRKSLNPFLELITLFKAVYFIHREQPDILHNFTIKPIVYGSIAAWFCHAKLKLINNFLGMGFIFINQNFLYMFIRKIVSTILVLTSWLRKVQYIVQNSDDKKVLIDYRVTNHYNVAVQCSVGVDTSALQQLGEPKGKPVFALVSRMLIDKGVHEFVAAARILKKKNIDAEFWLVGAPDDQNKSSLRAAELQAFDKEGIVRYLGFQDISRIWQKAHVAVLPSYREGLSRSLLEAGAYGRAIITTDAPGGRELVTDKINGLLVKPKDPDSLADAMEILVNKPALRKKLAEKMRENIVNHYDSKVIVNKILCFYDKEF